MICPRCKENVIGGNTICPKCGYNFSMNGNQDNMVNNNLNNVTNNNQTMNNTGGMFVNNGVSNNVVNNSSNYSSNFNNNLNSNISYENSNMSKEKKKNNKIIIAIIILIILGVLVFFGYKFFTGKNNDFETKEDGKIGFDAKTSFIQNSDFMYALFDYNGNQITDFIYKYVGIPEFVLYGTAIVSNDDGYFLIDQNGNELTKRGEYSDFELNGTLFDASYESDDSDKGYYLTLKGKKLFSKDEYEIVPPMYSFLTFSLVRNKKTKDVSYIDHNGKTVVTIPYKEGEELKYVFYDDKSFLTIFYNNKSYIFNLNTNKLLQTIDSKSLYAFDDYDEKDKILIAYNYDFQKNTDDKKYKVFKDGKLIQTDELETKCAYLHLTRLHVRFKQDMVVCEYDRSSDEVYLFDKSFNYIGDTKDYQYILNKDNYIKNHKLYKDEKEVKSLPCLVRGRSSKFNNEDIYFLSPSYASETCDGIKNGSGALYDMSGNKISNSFSYLGNFDSNGLAEASDDLETFSLINKKGEKVITGYVDYKYHDGYYMVKKNGSVGLIDKNGKEIFPCEYTTVEIKNAFGAKIVSLMKYGSPKIFVAYDLNNNKEIFNGPGTVEFNDTFYSIYDEKKNAEYYYSYSTGKIFFTRNF